MKQKKLNIWEYSFLTSGLTRELCLHHDENFLHNTGLEFDDVLLEPECSNNDSLRLIRLINENVVLSCCTG